MRYRLAIFDFDGTLADSFPWFLAAVNDVADRYGFRRVEEHELEALRGCDAGKIIGHLGLPAWKVPLVARHLRARMARDIGRIALLPGVDRLLRRLADRGVALAVVTSNSYANVRRILGPQSAALVRHYGCGASLFGKRAKLRKVLRASGIPPAAAICIGDEIRDLHAARAEGLAFGAVAWGYTRLESLRTLAPEEVFASMEEIAEKLTRGETRSVAVPSA